MTQVSVMANSLILKAQNSKMTNDTPSPALAFRARMERNCDDICVIVSLIQ